MPKTNTIDIAAFARMTAKEARKMRTKGKYDEAKALVNGARDTVEKYRATGVWAVAS